jgi:hypothetical protein
MSLQINFASSGRNFYCVPKYFIWFTQKLHCLYYLPVRKKTNNLSVAIFVLCGWFCNFILCQTAWYWYFPVALVVANSQLRFTWNSSLWRLVLGVAAWCCVRADDLLLVKMFFAARLAHLVRELISALNFGWRIYMQNHLIIKELWPFNFSYWEYGLFLFRTKSLD